MNIEYKNDIGNGLEENFIYGINIIIKIEEEDINQGLIKIEEDNNWFFALFIFLDIAGDGATEKEAIKNLENEINKKLKNPENQKILQDKISAFNKI